MTIFKFLMNAYSNSTIAPLQLCNDDVTNETRESKDANFRNGWNLLCTLAILADCSNDSPLSSSRFAMGVRSKKDAKDQFIRNDSTNLSPYDSNDGSNCHGINGKPILDILSSTGLPSTLVMCVSLFANLPFLRSDFSDHINNIPKDRDREMVITSNDSYDVRQDDILLVDNLRSEGLDLNLDNSNNSNNVKNFYQLFLEKFSSLTLILCGHSLGLAELIEKDDLKILFQAFTSNFWPNHLIASDWRNLANEAIGSALRLYSPPDALLRYLRATRCITICLNNVDRDLATYCSRLALSKCDSGHLISDPGAMVDALASLVSYVERLAEFEEIAKFTNANDGFLQEFRAERGYALLTDLALVYELDTSYHDAAVNATLLLTRLCSLAPDYRSEPPRLRNTAAFQALFSIYLEGHTDFSALQALTRIRAIFAADMRNYSFVRESVNPMARACERLPLFGVAVWDAYFDAFDTIMTTTTTESPTLFKELVALGVTLKQLCLDPSVIKINADNDYRFVRRVFEFLARVIRYDPNIFKDAVREAGLLDIAGSLLRPLACSKISTRHDTFISATDLLSLLIAGNNTRNADLFRECSGYVTFFSSDDGPLNDPALAPHFLSVMQQLLLHPGSDEDMKRLTRLLLASSSDTQLKIQVLKTLTFVMKESHRCRSTFRKVGGFVSLFSALVSLENCFAPTLSMPCQEQYQMVKFTTDKDKYRMLKGLLSLLTVSMRYEFANSKFFIAEIKYENFVETIKALGPFTPGRISHLGEITEISQSVDLDEITQKDVLMFYDTFDKIFSRTVNIISNETSMIDSSNKEFQGVPLNLIHACYILRHVYDIGLDLYERSNNCYQTFAYASLQSTLSVTSFENAIIVHPFAIAMLMELIYFIDSEVEPAKLGLQQYLMDIIKSVIRSERNQQIMCQQSGMMRLIMTKFARPLKDIYQPLHSQTQFIFERLATHAIVPEDLKQFLTIPMNVTDDVHKDCEALNTSLLNTVKCLVTMTTQSSQNGFNHHDNMNIIYDFDASFIEFNMSTEGFACVYIPSLAPQTSNINIAMTGVTIASGNPLIGGIGMGERIFPSQSGISFSSWFKIKEFGDISSNHPIRLLTLVRDFSDEPKKSQSKTNFCNYHQRVCLSMGIRTHDKAFWISTRDIPLGVTDLNTNVTGSHTPTTLTLDYIRLEQAENISGVTNTHLDSSYNFALFTETSTWFSENNWNHIGISINRSVLKNNSVTLYLNGILIGTKKMNYIIQYPMGSSSSNSSSRFLNLYAFIGSPPILRKFSKLTWQQGPVHLFEESMSHAQIFAIFVKGPSYIGNYLESDGVNSVQLTKILSANKDIKMEDLNYPIIPEEKIMLSLHPASFSTMTLSNIKKIFNRIDAKYIAKQMNMSTHDNNTPIKLLNNTSGHLFGSARSMGGIIIGYLGIRTFIPKPMAYTLFSIGGIPLILGLLALSNSSESFYASLKSLVGVFHSNPHAMSQMSTIRGYQMIALFLKLKKNILNNHILYLIFGLVGTIDSQRLTVKITNVEAFEDILYDFEVWLNLNEEAIRFLFQHHFELTMDSTESSSNIGIMQKMDGISKYLYFLHRHLIDSRDRIVTFKSFDSSCIELIFKILALMLKEGNFSKNLLNFGQFMTTLVPHKAADEHLFCYDHESDLPTLDHVNVKKIGLRNLCFDILTSLCFDNFGAKDEEVCSKIESSLGLDWFFNFMLPYIHESTFIKSLRLLGIVIGANSSTIDNFVDQDPSSFGHWLNNALSVLQKSQAMLLGYNLTSKNHEIPSDDHRTVKMNILAGHKYSSFSFLMTLILSQTDRVSSPIFLILFAWMLGQPIRQIPTCENRLNLDIICRYVFGVSPNTATSLNESAESNHVSVNEYVVYLILNLVSQMNADSRILTVPNKRESSPPCNVDAQTTLQPNISCLILQFFVFLYHNFIEFQSVCFQEPFLLHLKTILLGISPDSYQNFERDYDVTISLLDQNSQSNNSRNEIVMINKRSNDELPARKESHLKRLVKDFLKCIVVDSFDEYQSPKNYILDMILENHPSINRALFCRFQTDILTTTMEHLVAVDAVLSFSDNLPKSEVRSSSRVSNINKQINITYFSLKLVDKIWQGIYLDSSGPVFDFIINLIIEAKCNNWIINYECLYAAINRLILYQLSQDIITDKELIMNCLRKIINYKYYIFAKNSSVTISEFIAAMCYCLFRIHEASNLPPKYYADPDWHVLNTTANTTENNVNTIKNNPQSSALEQIRETSQKAWEELYLHNKSTIESVFRFNASTNPFLYPSLSNFRPLLYESSKRFWVTYIENEQKMSLTSLSGTNSPFYSASLIPSNLQQKLEIGLQKIGSGFGKSTKSKPKKEINFKVDNSSLDRIIDHIGVNISIISDLVDMQYDHFYQTQVVLRRQYAIEQWKKIEKELIRERSLWGSQQPDPLEKWILDSTEGPCRMRKKMTQNPDFYVHYPYIVSRDAVNHTNTKNKKFKSLKPPLSLDSELYYKRNKVKPKFVFLRELLAEHVNDICEKNRKGRQLNSLDIFCSKNRVDNDSNISTIKTNADNDLDAKITENLMISDGNLLDPADQFERDIRRLSMKFRRLSSGAANRKKREGTDKIINEPFSLLLDSDIKENVEDTDDVARKAETFSEQLMKDKIVDDYQSNVNIGSLEILSEGSSSIDNAKFTQGTEVIDSSGTLAQASSPLVSSIIPDNQAILRLIEEKETIKSMFRCARVDGLDTYEGLLLFGNHHYYIVDGFTLLKTREIRDIHTLPSNYHDPIIPFSPMQKDIKKKCHKFSYCDIKEVLKRRYLLLPIGLEIFSADGRNYLLVFPKTTRDKVYNRFLLLAKRLIDDAKSSIAGQRSNVNVEFSPSSSTTAGFLNTFIIGEKSVTKRWVKGEINNFQYLMYLNTLAGRSYNDLMQYPVFPWILSDYTSQDIDLQRCESFRDLGKPMGAQTPQRLAQFRKRFDEWDRELLLDSTSKINSNMSGGGLVGGAGTESTPPYHYGTCYSSAMIVASYLFRMEPFTQHFLKLQGGHFDLPDRMFHSVGEAWLSASLHNMADVKESLPEFYYSPPAQNFLVNANHFSLGRKQSGPILNDVVLPPWAKSDPTLFITINRAALESPFVSARLNQWIDLIFGYKQRDSAAIEAVNVFHYLFYEGSSDIFMIDDPMEKNAIVGFINNFGQIPSQLFKKPHPTKRLNIYSFHYPFNLPLEDGMESLNVHTASSASDLLGSRSFTILHYLDLLKLASINPIKQLREGSVGQILSIDDIKNTISNLNSMFLAVEQNKTLCFDANSKVVLSWGHPDKSILYHYLSDSIQTNSYAGTYSTYAASMSISNYRTNMVHPNLSHHHLDPYMVQAQYNDVNIIPFDCHCSPGITLGVFMEITCCVALYHQETAAISNSKSDPYQGHNNNNLLLITGGSDGVIRVITRNETGTASERNNVKCLYGHDEAVTCLAASKTFKVMVSGSRDRTILLWDLNRLSFVKQLIPPLIHQNKGLLKNNSFNDSGDNDAKNIMEEGEMFQYTSPISALHINDLTGDIISCAGSDVYLWNVNGQFISHSDMNGIPLPNEQYIIGYTQLKRDNSIKIKEKFDKIKQGFKNCQILCTTMTHYTEWDPINLIFVGSNDGLVRILALEYIISQQTEDSHDTTLLQLKATQSNNYILKSNILTTNPDEENSVVSNTQQTEVLDKTDDLVPCIEEQKTIDSYVAPTSHYDYKDPIIKIINENTTPDDKDDFESFTVEDIESAKKYHEQILSSSVPIAYYYRYYCSPSNKPPSSHIPFLGDDKYSNVALKNHQWVPTLVLKYIMISPANDICPVTALAISKDHKHVFCGDGKGRIYAWNLPTNLSHIANQQWLKNGPENPNEIVNKMTVVCQDCNAIFNFSERKQFRCKNCNLIFCSKCLKYESKIDRLKILKPVKICKSCHKILKII
ncbi:unnamed protein product [Gordionus sp. m RMFG-2023]